MGVILDLISSLIFGGSLVMIIVDANSTATEIHQQYAGDMTVQEVLTGVVQSIDGEFRNMGFGVPDTAASIISADSTSVTFLSSLDGTGGHVDTVRYWSGSTDELLGTQNELDKPLYRQQNHDTPRSIGLVTTFALKYLDYKKVALALPVAGTSLKNIQTIEVTVEVQSPFAELREQGMVQSGERNALYSSSLWQQTRLVSQNFKR